MGEDAGPQLLVALEPAARPAPRPGLLIGIGGAIADQVAAVALQLPRDRRWRAIQSCSDLPDRSPGLAKLGNRTPLLQAELSVPLSHGNTLSWCCTSFVNSGDLRSERC